MAIVMLRYFAAAADAAGREAEELDIGPEHTLGALRDELTTRYGDPMARVLKSGSFLVDGVVRRDLTLPVGERVDILPPFAGG
ncbi:ThiS family protein [Microbacterium hydrocarbonoxydans]|uniref:ThiS family protein n=1 Tax=Microbacterium hydrocarbonoxydans TaxID=273678 RepID=A0A0M2HTR4_9MICO|nr:MoaD/ThiS family protein [Microbacterium hydrocarbonoxydans]KJL47879.1 ThiS family protein [Microbacterium hydrocarbonoxydans]